MANNGQLDNTLTNLANDPIKTLDQLYDIQAKNAPGNVYLPFAHNIYDIDLDTRIINGPETLSVRRDHRAEVIYFKVDRYFDYMDLANTICIIQYLIPNETIPRIYVVPFLDTSTCAKEDKIIFPWVVGGMATAIDGIVEYSVRFYKVQRENENDIKLLYNLSTLPTTAVVKKSLEGDGEIMNAEYDQYIGAHWEDLINQVMSLQTTWITV